MLLFCSVVLYLSQIAQAADAVSPLGDDCFTNQYEKLNDPAFVQIPYDVSVSPTYPEKALNFENPISFLELARKEVVKAWNNFMNSICQTEPKTGMEWAGQCRVFVSKLRDKFCYFSALYPGRGGQYNFDPWEVVQEEVAHVGYYLTGQYLDMFGIGGNDAQKAEQFARIQEWYYAQRNKIGRWGEVKIYGAKFGPTFDQYVRLTGPIEKDGSQPTEDSPYQQRNVLEQFWGVNGKVAKKEYGSWENLGYLFRIVQESALGVNGERWDYVLSHDDLTLVEPGTNPPVYKVHDEFHELRKQVRAMWINLREYPEIMPSAWISLTIPGPSGGFALWDTATFLTKSVDGHSMIKALFDNDEKHRNYYRSWGWTEDQIWLATALALGGYYHIDLEGPGRIPQTLETQAMWDFVERFGYINDQMMDFRFGVAAGKDSAWVEGQKADINNKWKYLKRWLTNNNLKSYLTGIAKMLPATSCSASKQPTSAPTVSPTAPTTAFPSFVNDTRSPSLPPSFAPTSLAPSALPPPTPEPAPTPAEKPIIEEISSLESVPSVSYSPVPLPSISNVEALKAKKALFVVSHGSNEYQTVYMHQYLTERGATVTFGCPILSPGQTQAVLANVFKPTYTVACAPLVNITLATYDIVVVMGGSVAASDLRLQPLFTKQLGTYWSTPGKVLVCISTGSEVLIEAGIVSSLPELVVDPTSMWSFRKVLQHLKKLPAATEPFNWTIGSITTKLNGRATLIMSKDSASLNDTAIQLGETLGLVGEKVDETNKRYVNLVDGVYQSSEIKAVRIMSQLPVVPPSVPINTNSASCDVAMSGKTVGIIVASGADAMQVAYILNHADKCNATAYIVCSEDTLIFDEGWAYLFSNPPARLEGRVKCSMDLEKLLLEHYQKGGEPELDIIIIPGGPTSTDLVLTSDFLVRELVERQIGAGRVLGLVGTGASVLLPTGLVPKSKLAASKYVQMDLYHSGYAIPGNLQSIGYKQVFAEAEDPESPHPSGLGYLVVGTGDAPADFAPFMTTINSALRGEGNVPEIAVVIPDKPVKQPEGSGDEDGGVSVVSIVLPIVVLLVLIGAGVAWYVKNSHRTKPYNPNIQDDEVADVLSSSPENYAPLR